MDRVSIADVIPVPIDSIVVGVRRRIKLGRLKALAQSIEAHGLIHPILLRGTTLVAGHRRLEACRSLAWRTIPARQVDHMSDDELRAVELDENTTREDLTDLETSKARLAQMRQAEADLKAKAEADLRFHEKHKSKRKRGRQPEPGSKRDIAGAIGISPSEQVKTERHVDLAERYPFMGRGGWLRTHVLDAGDAIEHLPEADRSPIAALLDQDAIPPKDAIGILHKVGALSSAERREIIQLSQSADEHIRQTALTKAAQVPPPVDPGLLALGTADEHLRKAARTCRDAAFRPRLSALADEAHTLLTAFQEANRHARRHAVSVSTPVHAASTPA